MQATAREESDEQLMGRVMLGDRAALSLLVERHHSPLMGYLYRLLDSDRPLAEDLTQETFVRLLTSADSDKSGYQTGRPFKPWLYSIATNLARDHFKSAATRRIAGGLDTAQGQAALVLTEDQAPGPERTLLQVETGEEIARAIGRLPTEYRAALLLRFYGDMSLQEIADTLDVPLGTVKSRLSVGCRRLRALLTGSLDEENQQPDRKAGGRTRNTERGKEAPA